MKKKLLTLIAAGAMTLSMTISAFAGIWQQDDVGWWWQNDDGSYPVSCWKWIDGNNDGIAEYYYFDAVGYLLVNTITPDGNQVDANGAWIVNGVVQTQAVVVSAQPAPQPAAAPAPQQTGNTVTNTTTATSTSGLQASDTVWLSATGSKFHKIPNCGKMNPSKARAVTYGEALRQGYEQCDKCY